VAAGVPIFAPSRTQQDADHFMSLPREIVGTGELFSVRVKGNSMRDAGILNGDFVIVRLICGGLAPAGGVKSQRARRTG
jgi:repressor LexA